MDLNSFIAKLYLKKRKLVLYLCLRFHVKPERGKKRQRRRSNEKEAGFRWGLAHGGAAQ